MKTKTDELISEYETLARIPKFDKEHLKKRQAIAKELLTMGIDLPENAMFRHDTFNMKGFLPVPKPPPKPKTNNEKKRTIQTDRAKRERRHTTIRFDPKIWRKAKAKAALEGKTLTDVIREALTRYVNSKTEPPEEKD